MDDAPAQRLAHELAAEHVQPVEPHTARTPGLDLAGVSRDEVAAAIASVAVAVEVIDSRIADWRIAVQGTVADTASSAYAVDPVLALTRLAGPLAEQGEAA
ncbi:hypothetical protein [Blastococcus mobilis]|uniref:Uncharacterized protein n=1 Tax=Blastococcus mobilis TaxID=1938746 RepID=A0A238Y994_9ACTN|nr:hypothetical protein [Blastococcus mobilis]SNR67707.1 hypothetical protein SAMN06272737_118104 [Blastococcus mobilis]